MYSMRVQRLCVWKPSPEHSYRLLHYQYSRLIGFIGFLIANARISLVVVSESAEDVGVLVE